MVIWIVIVVVHDVILFIFRENDVFHLELDEAVNIMDWSGLIIKVQTCNCKRLKLGHGYTAAAHLCISRSGLEFQ